MTLDQTTIDWTSTDIEAFRRIRNRLDLEISKLERQRLVEEGKAKNLIGCHVRLTKLDSRGPSRYPIGHIIEGTLLEPVQTGCIVEIAIDGNKYHTYKTGRVHCISIDGVFETDFSKYRLEVIPK